MTPRTETNWLVIGFLVALLVTGGFLVSIKLLGVRTISVPHPEGSSAEVNYAQWGDALKDWVVGDGVDYKRVLEEAARLHEFAGQLATTGPSTSPERFAPDSEKLAYYINAYNAFTLLGVTENWPIDSVQAVRGWVEPKAGFGFFYGLRFEMDGRRINLYDLENEVIRGFGDARIHAAINCASKSCPALQPFAFTPSGLEAQLDQVTREFCSSSKHVRIDREARVIELSAIFEWYQIDFVDHAGRLGADKTVTGFISHFARPPIPEMLEFALAEGFDLRTMPYDWALNHM